MRGAASTSRGSDESETQVVLNVYDLTDINNYTTWFGFGVFHSGVQGFGLLMKVHGKEYGFGAHEFPVSGVFEVEPMSCPGYIYRCSISLGQVNMPPDETRAFIETMASEYHGDTYNLISKNCNHFSDDLSKRLTGKGIPRWVNRLAGLGSMCSCLLPESLQLTTVKSPQYHNGSEDGIGSSSSWESSTEIDETNSEQQLLPQAIKGEVAFVSVDPGRS